MFVGSTREAVHVIDTDKNGKAQAVTQILSRQKVPNGIAWHRDYLYVAEQHRITDIMRGISRQGSPGMQRPRSSTISSPISFVTAGVTSAWSE